MRPSHLPYFLSVLLLLLQQTATADVPNIETQQDLLAKAARTSPNGVAAGFTTLNGIRFPIMAFLNETSYESFRDKIRETFKNDADLIEQGTLQAKSFLIVPKKVNACSTCLDPKKKVLVHTLQQSLAFSWIETPEIRLAYASPLGPIVQGASSHDAKARDDVNALIPGAHVGFSQSYNFPNTSIKSFAADVPLASTELSANLKRHYESAGWSTLAVSDHVLIVKKEKTVVNMSFESVSKQSSRMMSYEVTNN